MYAYSSKHINLFIYVYVHVERVCNGSNVKGGACSGCVKDTGLCALSFVHQALCIDQVGDTRKGGDGRGRACSGVVKDTLFLCSNLSSPAIAHRLASTRWADNGGDGPARIPATGRLTDRRRVS